MNTCENCVFSTCFNQFGFSQYSKTYNTIVVPDMSCPRFESKKSEVPMFLKDWKPEWHGLMEPEPPTRQLVLMWYMGEPKPKVGFVIGGIWYKAAGSTTPPPDFWTELP